MNFLIFLQFQFHKGTIKTWSGTANDDKLLIFQFHKGTIKTTHQHENYTFEVNFNSIKVRLKQVQHEPTLLDDKFQFHKGTIKTSCTSEAGGNDDISIP